MSFLLVPALTNIATFRFQIRNQNYIEYQWHCANNPIVLLMEMSFLLSCIVRTNFQLSSI